MYNLEDEKKNCNSQDPIKVTYYQDQTKSTCYDANHDLLVHVLFFFFLDEQDAGDMNNNKSKKNIWKHVKEMDFNRKEFQK